MKLDETPELQNDDVYPLLRADDVIIPFNKMYDYWDSQSRHFTLPASMFSEQMINEARQEVFPFIIEIKRILPEFRWATLAKELEDWFNS